MNKLKNMTAFTFAICMFNAGTLQSDVGVSDEDLSRIQENVQNMTQVEMVNRKSSLIAEKAVLETKQSETQSPSQNKSIQNKLNLVLAELSLIQKTLLSLAGVGLIGSVTSDDYNDDVPPVITLNGNATVDVELGGSTYTDAGASANDANHGTTNVVASGAGAVDVNTLGVYLITYTATDLSGNTATATRTVNVVDTTNPVVTVTSPNPITFELGQPTYDYGATATDISGPVTVVGPTPAEWGAAVDSGTAGTYTVTYTATDASGNTGTATRTVNIVDTVNPVVTVSGSNPITFELGQPTYDDGATATDASGPVTVVGPTPAEWSAAVDSGTAGTYTVTYTATDTSGNTGTATRTVNIADTVNPVFTSSSTFIVDENVTAVGTVTATDASGSVTFTISGTELSITSAGLLSFISAPDYESQANPGYYGTTMDVTATVTATDASNNTATQDIVVQVRDIGGIDDNPATGTGTSTNTGTGTGTSTSTGTGTGTGTGT